MARAYDLQGWLVFEGILESIACLLAICTLLCLKAHMNYKRAADEKELVMYLHSPVSLSLSLSLSVCVSVSVSLVLSLSVTCVLAGAGMPV